MYSINHVDAQNVHSNYVLALSYHHHERCAWVRPSSLQALVHVALDHYFLILITFLLLESLHHQCRTIS